jgi:hypothetical protein
LVKDSSGKKILGTHPTKKAAVEQLAAIESSKARRKNQLKELFRPTTNSVDNFYMLNLSKLKQKKEILENELKELKMKNLINFLSENPQNIGSNPYSHGAQMGQQPQQIQSQQRPIRGRKRPFPGEQQDFEQDSESNNNPFPMSQSHMGMALTPQSANAQRELITKYFDDPNTPNREQTNEPTWQNLQTSIANSVGQEVNQKLRQFGLLG